MAKRWTEKEDDLARLACLYEPPAGRSREAVRARRRRLGVRPHETWFKVDFSAMRTVTVPLPPGWAWVNGDLCGPPSGEVGHDSAPV